ncbi:MAG: DMT family transporter [Sphingobium sp.]|nr:DMT family transporter [Sphingobium sp.]
MEEAEGSGTPAQPHHNRFPPNVVGGLWIIASAIAFTAMMTLVKFLGNDYPAAVQSTYRQMASLVMMAPIIIHDPRGALASRRPGLIILTMALSTLGLVLSLYSYQLLPFANANALSFSRILWLVPLAALVLRERIGWMRGGAALTGFIGVTIMLEPSQGFHLGIGELAALAASLMAAIVIICMKTLMREHKLATIMAWSATVGFLFSAIPALFVWRWPSLVDFLLLAIMGVLGVATQASYIKGVSIGEAAAIVPLDYSRLLMAAAIGWLLFDEVPSSSTLIGGAVVIGSTLILSWYEVRTYRAAEAIVAAQE